MLREGFIWGAPNERDSSAEYLALARIVGASQPPLPMYQRLLGTTRIGLNTKYEPESWNLGESGLVWAGDNRASHEAVCPVCGTGNIAGSGDRSVTLDIWFEEGGPARSIDRPVRRLQLRCDRRRPRDKTVFPQSKTAARCHSLVLKAAYSSADNEWRDGRTTQEYLKLIESPLASHPTILALPVLADAVVNSTLSTAMELNEDSHT